MSLVESGRYAVMVMVPLQTCGSVLRSLVWVRRTPMRDLYVVPKSGGLPLYRVPPETSAVSKVLLDLIFRVIPQG